MCVKKKKKPPKKRDCFFILTIKYFCIFYLECDDHTLTLSSLLGMVDQAARNPLAVFIGGVNRAGELLGGARERELVLLLQPLPTLRNHNYHLKCC